MTPLAGTPSRESIRLAVDGRRLVFRLSRDGGGSWGVEHDGRELGLVYRLALPDAGWQWRARPRGRPAPAIGHATRARAIAALYEATRP